MLFIVIVIIIIILIVILVTVGVGVVVGNNQFPPRDANRRPDVLDALELQELVDRCYNEEAARSMRGGEGQENSNTSSSDQLPSFGYYD